MEVNDPYRSPAPGPLPESAGLPFGEGRRVPIGHGWWWLRDAWRIVGRNKALWALALLVLAVLLSILGLVSLFIPLIGNLALIVVAPVLCIGLFHIAHRRAAGQEFEFGDLFIGFSSKTGPLLMAGLAQMVLQVSYMMILFIVGISLLGSDLLHLFLAGFSLNENGLEAMLMPDPGLSMMIKTMIIGLVALALAVPYLSALLFQVPLVYFGDRQAFPALVESLKVTLSNSLPLFWSGVLAMVVMSLFALAVGVAAMLIEALFGYGLAGDLLLSLLFLLSLVVGLVLFSTGCVAVYVAFRDIFGQETEAVPAPRQQELW